MISQTISKTPLLTQTTRRRRDRLADLRRDIDPTVWEERRRALRALLVRPLLTTAGNERTLVNRHREWLGLWLAHHPGWELHIDADACRLVKRPARLDDDSRPCRDPTTKDVPLSRRGYVFLCLVLSILVREDRQITLKNIAESLAGMGRADPIFVENGAPLELDHRAPRRDLVHALRVLIDWGVLARVAGIEDGYVASASVDVLYNINRPILSRLHASRLSPSLVKDRDFEIRLEKIWRGPAPVIDSDDHRKREIRFNFYRRLLDDPVLYFDDLDDDERDYLEKQRSFIVREIEEATGLIGEVRAEGIAMVDRVGDLSDYSLPETGTDGHLTLLLATLLADRLRAGDTTAVPVSELEAETRRLAKENQNWRKDARQSGAEAVLTRDAIARLRALGLVRTEQHPVPCVTPLAAIGRFGLREAETVSKKPHEAQSELF